MKKHIFFLACIFVPFFTIAQKGEIRGVVKDAGTGEALIGANILYGEGLGTVTDFEGNYSLTPEYGEYTLTVSFIGYKTQVTKVKLAGKSITLNFSLEYNTLNEVEIIADVAVDRETPVAFSTIPVLTIQQELGSRDIPMILNSTPGVYATEQGGGSGDARISVRGFDQRNVAVMVDGIPVNDMENGQVYWSNWDGLGGITRSMQVQRGLGASKLALASVGGTINIITRGIESKMGGSVAQEFGGDNFLKTTVSFNSGLLKNGFGVTFAASYKTGDGWVDRSWVKAYSYFLKIQKTLGNHLLSFGVNGAPQSHGQRTDKKTIANFDREFAEELGINVDSIYKKDTKVRARGLRYNPNWGQYIDSNGVAHTVTERVNFYHKPLYSISDFWKPNDKIYFSNVAYLSVGKGGGTGGLSFSGKVTEIFSSGQQDYQTAYNSNSTLINSGIDTVLHESRTILRASQNDHFWYGLLSTLSYSPNNLVSLILGFDARSYKGSHYQTVYDLLGGDYYKDLSNSNDPKGKYFGDPNYNLYNMKSEGDKIGYFNVGLVKWGGVFCQAEIKTGRWAGFVTVTGSQTGYQRIDYFKKKDLVIDGVVYDQAVGWRETYFLNGTDTLIALYADTITTSGDTTFVGPKSNPKKNFITHAKGYTINSPEARTATTEWAWFPGYTIKGGLNFNITENQNIFANVGYLSMAPRFNNVFDNSNHLFWDIQNQFVKALELGYGFRYKKFAANVNGYYTIWENKPPDFVSTTKINDETVSFNINGLDAVHKGLEVDFVIKPYHYLQMEQLISVADWKYNSSDTVRVTDEQGNVVAVAPFLAEGVHVGNSAQLQFSESIRIEFLKNFYVKARYTNFSNNYANFDPTTLNGVNANRDSWKMPNYSIVDAFLGFEMKTGRNKNLESGSEVKNRDIRYSLTAGVFNVFNTMYISDAQNGADFDATTATVFFGQGRRYNVGLKILF